MGCAALPALARCGRPPRACSVGELLYARVDVIGDRRDPQVLELELVSRRWAGDQLDGTTRTRQQREFALGVEISPGPARAWTALASTPTSAAVAADAAQAAPSTLDGYQRGGHAR